MRFICCDVAASSRAAHKLERYVYGSISGCWEGRVVHRKKFSDGALSDARSERVLAYI